MNTSHKFLLVIVSWVLLAAVSVNADHFELKVNLGYSTLLKMQTTGSSILPSIFRRGGWKLVEGRLVDAEYNWNDSAKINTNSMSPTSYLSIKALAKNDNTYYSCTPETRLSSGAFKNLVGTDELNGKKFELDVTCSNLNPKPKENLGMMVRTEKGTCSCMWTLAN